MSKLRNVGKACVAVALCASLFSAGAANAQTQSSYFDAVDTNDDGRVSLGEFLQRLSWAFEQMDKNRDQVLSPDEQLVPNAPSLSLAEHQRRLTEQFHRQDKNKDGSLSPREFLAPPG